MILSQNKVRLHLLIRRVTQITSGRIVLNANHPLNRSYIYYLLITKHSIPRRQLCLLFLLRQAVSILTARYAFNTRENCGNSNKRTANL